MTHPHLSDEQLSAHLDGEAGDERAAGLHLASCPDCARRRAVLDRASALVRTPVGPVPPGAAVSAVRAAVAEVAEARSPGVASAQRGSWWTRRPRVLAGVAAVIAAAAVAVPVSLSGGHGTQQVSSAAKAAPSAHAAKPSSNSTGASAPTSSREPTQTLQQPAGTAGASPADLGTLSSVVALRSRLTTALSGNGSAAFATAGRTAEDAPEASAAPAASAAASAGSEACEPAALRVAGTTHAVELVAVATYEGVPALVVVVRPSPRTSGAVLAPVAVVVARSGCRLLVSAALPSP